VTSSDLSDGPLSGVKVLELVGLGPAPFANQLLADLGADVIGISRPGARTPALAHNRPIVGLDLKSAEGVDAVKELSARADVVTEGFRPGVMERLGLGPADLMGTNPGLVYARMTGWGQTGRLAPTAGHDINYIALSGALHVAGRAGMPPVPPANLLGDFGGGGLYLVTAVLAALVERARTGSGQVLDVAITDGTAYLSGMLHEYRTEGRWSDVPGTNRLDTGAPYYDVYTCSDGRYVAVGALEDQFFDALARLLGLDESYARTRHDPATWPQLRSDIAEKVMGRTRDEWAELAADTDACLTPVLSLAEAPVHPHAVERETFRAVPGGWVPRLPQGHRPAADPLADMLGRWGVGVDALPGPAIE
jgi:alpha-methylacyl-CoA racemase